MFEWSVAVACPVRLVRGSDAGRRGTGDHMRDLHVWTSQHSAVDAYDEALRVVEGWPTGARPVDVALMGMYVPATSAENARAGAAD